MRNRNRLEGIVIGTSSITCSRDKFRRSNRTERGRTYILYSLIWLNPVGNWCVLYLGRTETRLEQRQRRGGGINLLFVFRSETADGAGCHAKLGADLGDVVHLPVARCFAQAKRVMRNLMNASDLIDVAPAVKRMGHTLAVPAMHVQRLAIVR